LVPGRLWPELPGRKQLEAFLRDWGYPGIFLGLVGTGLGLPLPEELPVVIAGGLTRGHDDIFWYIMLPVCIAGVIVGDGCLYAMGRLWGPRLLQYQWIQRRVFPPDRLAKIEQNFEQYGVKLLLFARLTPGIRAPVFFTAGMTKLPLARFLLADGLYAIPGVSLLFFLGYWFADSMVEFVQVKSIIVIPIIVIVIGYFTYRALKKPGVTGDPTEMPPLVEQVTHKLEQVTTKIMHPISGHHALPPEEPNRPASGVDGQAKPGLPPAQADQPQEHKQAE
jgi:membrane protein DedA with SNARE-associated domain